MSVFRAGKTLMLNNFPKARAGEGLDVIKFVAGLKKYGKDTVYKGSLPYRRRSASIPSLPGGFKSTFFRHLSDV
jgi:hypothetical protein